MADPIRETTGRRITCPACGGVGQTGQQHFGTCPRCNGEGIVDDVGAARRQSTDPTTPEEARLRLMLTQRQREIERLHALLARYRDETPLGHQPHMIAAEVDAALGRKA